MSIVNIPVKLIKEAEELQRQLHPTETEEFITRRVRYGFGLCANPMDYINALRYSLSIIK